MACSVFQGALAERQQLIPELVRNGDEENPLKVSNTTCVLTSCVWFVSRVEFLWHVG